jgi:hypothetical protein
MTEINIRFGPLCGFKSDMSRGPRSSKSCHLQCSKPVPLFDYFVRMQQERFWNREAECFRCLQIKSNVRFAPKPTEVLRCRAKLTRCDKRQSSAQTTANVKSRVASCLNCFRSCCQFRGEVTSDDPVDS